MTEKLPEWLKKKIPKHSHISSLHKLIGDPAVHTVCESAHCPNVGECYEKNTATFMILGNVCSRDCSFCAVDKGCPEPVDPTEPGRVAKAAKKLGLNYVVITSVTRDDLPDGGADQFAETIRFVRDEMPEAKIEVLTPDFKGSKEALQTVFEARPDVFNHNLETIPRLYSKIRPQANYCQSLNVLRLAAENHLYTKSGLMVGLGESFDEVVDVLKDLRKVEVDIVTIGQYLRPSKQQVPVQEYIDPEIFEKYHQTGMELGFQNVFSGPFVRSSYRAEEIFNVTGT